VGYLPLALSHAAAYCATGTSFADYLELLDALPAQELFDSSPEASYTQAVASTWRASIQASSASAPLAGELLALAAHLAPDAIPRSLFDVLIDPGLALERKHLRDGFNALARFSLATVDDETVSVHRLLGKVVRDDARARADASAVKRALAALDHAFPADPSDAARWPRSEQLLAHVIALADAAAGVSGTAAQVIELLNRACEYLICAEGGARGLAFAQSTVMRATRALGVEHPSTLTARHREAMAYRHAGRASEAIDRFEALLGDEERILRSEHPDTLRTRHELAVAYLDAGRVPGAIAIYKPLLDQCERILGAEHPDTLTTRHELADAYRDVGRVLDAIAIYEPLLADRERIVGAEHPSTLATRNNLALTYRDAGRVADAIAIYEPLLADREQIVGAEHPDTMATRHNLAVAYLDAGRVADAIAILQPLLADEERILGPAHPDTMVRAATTSPSPTWTSGAFRRRSRSCSRCSPSASGSSAQRTPTRSPPAPTSPTHTRRSGATRTRLRSSRAQGGVMRGNGPLWLCSREPALLSASHTGSGHISGLLERRGSCRSKRNHGLMLEKLSASNRRRPARQQIGPCPLPPEAAPAADPRSLELGREGPSQSLGVIAETLLWSTARGLGAHRVFVRLRTSRRPRRPLKSQIR
jgi:tetratricopeptide (TPR) repeat protein